MKSEKQKTDYKIFAFTALIFLGVTVAALLVFATVMYLIEGGYEYSPLFATISAAIGSLVSSLFLARKKQKNGLLIGGAMGIIVFLLLLITALILGNFKPSINTFFRFIIIMLSSLIGGVIGVNKNSNPKYI